MQYLLFGVDDQIFGMPLAAVSRVARAVETKTLPGAPATVRGVINYGGELVPALDMRRRLGVAARELRASDQFILFFVGGRRAALMVDWTGDVYDPEDWQTRDADSVWPGVTDVRGVARMEADIVVIYDLERFFTPEESRRLEGALARAEEA